MSPYLYRRLIRTSVAGLVIEDLRQSLSIERHSDQTQDRGALAVYNLSPAHESRIRDRGGSIVIEAGYPDTLALVFDGEVQRALRGPRANRPHHADHARRPGAAEGQARRRQQPRLSWRRVVRGAIARDLIIDMGLTAGPLNAIPDSATFTDFHWAGFPSAGGLRALLNGSSPSLAQIQWHEADGVIRFSAPGEAQVDAPTIALSPETGLIESPIVTDEGAEARAFLNPAIVLGCLIDLRSAALTGMWKVVALRHTADTWQGEFETGMDLREVET